MRSCLLALFCALIALPVIAAPVTTADQAVDKMEKMALPDGKDEVILQVWGPVPAGTEVLGCSEHVMTTPADGYVIFIDDYPTANLFHPVRYAFVSSGTGEVTVVDASSPPENYADYERIETRIWNQLSALENRRAPKPAAPHEPIDSDRWAVLMNGGHDSGNNHIRYWNDLSNIYMALNAVYGFADDHIIVLCSDGLNPAPDQSNGQNSDPDLDGDGDDDIMFQCDLANVDAVFANLVTTLVPEDKLFIFSTDHGSSDGGWSTHFNLWNHEELLDSHFASLLAALPQCEVICTFEPCFSGGFLDDVVVPPGPIVASSSCRHDEYSWAMPPDYMYDTYVFHWTAAVKGEDAYGVVVDADYNSDGVVTMDEAFIYAEIHDTSDEEPQYGDYPVGIGAGISLWPTGTGPFLVVADKEFDDIGGNNNGAPDPGETVSMLVTLSNVGNGIAENITGTLTTTDPYLTVTQNYATYPDLGQFEQGQGTPEYMLDISSACPQGQSVVCDMHITANGGYENDVVVSFTVGDPVYDPCGPDSYGYMAYDPFDEPEFPVYEWVEICADSGGPGTLVNFTMDDETFQFDLPFDFQYYGQSFTRYTIAANGWIGMGDILEDDYSNSGIPDSDGPNGMIALYWEDLSPQRVNSGRVWNWYDETDHMLIVEYNHIEQYAPTGSFETFQVILLDPDYYPTGTNDGRIIFQYKDMSATAQTEGTVGIENPGETIGLEYLYDGSYDLHASQIRNEMAILFTTVGSVPEMTIALTYVSGSPVPAGGGNIYFDVYVENAGLTPLSFDAWLEIVYEGGTPSTVVMRSFTNYQPGWTINRPNMFFPVPGSYASGNYTFTGKVGVHPSVVWDESGFPFVKSGTDYVAGFIPWVPDGVPNPFDEIDKGDARVAPTEFTLLGAYPNPFNPTTAISYQLSAVSLVNLSVYDISGRKVAELVDGWRNAGVHEATFDASDLASGIYIYRIEAGDFSAVRKMVLVK